MNYGGFVQAIEQYTENYEDSFVASIPTFLKNAEKRVYNDVELPVLRKNSVGAVASGNKYLTLPTDWLATYSLAVINGTTNAQTYLLDKDVEFIREAYPDPDDSGTPKHYAQFDSTTIILGPTPDATYNVELHYFYYPATIADSAITSSTDLSTLTNTTWLGDNYDFVLLYGALREAAVYMQQESDIVAMYEKGYQESLDKLVVLAKGKLRRDTYRNTQARAAVT